MTIFISHISALQYLLSHRIPQSRNAIGSLLPETRQRPKKGGTPNKRKFQELSIPDGILSSPLHINVRQACDRTRYPEVTSHVWDGPERGTYLWINEDFCVQTPEACFLQLASTLHLAHLVEIGFLLCGTYLPNSIPAVEKRDLAPLTTPEKLMRYALRAAGKPGARKARTALNYIRAGSASAMESKIATLCFLQTEYGGSQLPALLNAEISLTDEARGLNWSSIRKPDFLWPDHMVALDYDSTEWHDEKLRAEYDQQRRNELSAMNIRSIVARARDFRTLSNIQQITGQLRAAMGRKKPKTWQYAEKQRFLFDLLFGEFKWELNQSIPAVPRIRFPKKKRQGPSCESTLAAGSGGPTRAQPQPRAQP